MDSEVWVGTIEISYFDWGTPEIRKNAFTVATTWASDTEEFTAKCRQRLESYGWRLLGVEKANPVSVLCDFSDEVADMLERANVDPNALIFGTFYTYRVM